MSQAISPAATEPNSHMVTVATPKVAQNDETNPRNEPSETKAEEAPTVTGGQMLRKPKAAIVERWEKIVLYLLLVGFLVAMIYFLRKELSLQESNFQQGAALARETYEKVASEPTSTAYRPDVALLYTFQFSRALEFAHVKTAAVIIGTLVVCLGCLIVVYGVEASYQLTVNPKADSASSLTTSSPGLVLITLGVLIIIVAQIMQSTFDTQVEWVLPGTQTNPTSTEVPNARQFPAPNKS